MWDARQWPKHLLQNRYGICVVTDSRGLATGKQKKILLISAGVALSSSGLVCMWALASNLGAVFGPIDDHEPLRWMGRDNVLSFSEFFQVLIHDTEIGDFGSAIRFRPTYYASRILQTVVFGPNPESWYLFVISAYAVANALLGLSVATWLSLSLCRSRLPRTITTSATVLSAAAATVAFATLPAWRGIAARLGTAELLGMLAVALLAYSVTQILMDRAAWWWGLILMSTFVAVGAKETMLPLAIVPAIVAVDRIRAGGSRQGLLLAAALGIASGAFIVAAILPPLVLDGSQAYGSSDEGSRLTLAAQALIVTYRWYWIPPLVAVVLALASLVASRSTSRRLAGTLSAFILLSVLWFVFDVWVYSGTYQLPRYELNTQLVKALWIAGALALSLFVMRQSSSKLVVYAATATFLLSAGLAISIFARAPETLAALRNESDTNAQATQLYRNQMDGILRSLGKSSGLDIFIIPGPGGDVEPIHAISQELQLSQPHDTRVIVVTADTPSAAMQPLDAIDACIFVNQDIREVALCEEGPVKRFRIDARGM